MSRGPFDKAVNDFVISNQPFQIFPAVYVLTTRKTEECYTAVFKFITKKLFKMRPNLVMVDYENGLRASIRKCWPRVQIRGCWFHYCKAINRRCRKHNMTKLLKKNSGAKKIKKALMSLPLLPEDKIIEGYESIKKLARKKRLFKRFSSIFSYFESFWLRQV